MSVELLYTSAASGLKQGSRGFCTVLSTQGMPINLANRLESLSAYRHVFPPGHPEASKNPVAYSHLRMSVGGRALSVLSRISDYGVDYSGRTNKLAHHIVLDANDFAPAGPAWVLSQPTIIRSQWDGQCATPAVGPTIPAVDIAPGICTEWQRQRGDAGWGGVVAEAFTETSNSKPLWIVFDLAQSSNLLSLLNESIALLPQNLRWQATFSTYAMNLPPDAECKVRCVVAGTDDARLAPARGKVIDLTKPAPALESSRTIELARTGVVVAPKAAAPAAVPHTTGSANPSLRTPGSAAAPIALPESDEYTLAGLSSTPPSSTHRHGGLTGNMPPVAPPSVSASQKRRERTNASSASLWRDKMFLSLSVAAIAALLLLLIGGGLIWRYGSEKPTLVAAEQHKAEQEKASLEKAEQERAEQEKAAQERAEQEKAEQEKAEQLKAEQLKAEQLKAEQLKAEQLKAEQLKAEQLKAEQLKAEQLKAEQLKAEQLKAEQLKAEQLKAEQPKEKVDLRDRESGTEFEDSSKVGIDIQISQETAEGTISVAGLLNGQSIVITKVRVVSPPFKDLHFAFSPTLSSQPLQPGKMAVERPDFLHKMVIIPDPGQIEIHILADHKSITEQIQNFKNGLDDFRKHQASLKSLINANQQFRTEDNYALSNLALNEKALNTFRALEEWLLNTRRTAERVRNEFNVTVEKLPVGPQIALYMSQNNMPSDCWSNAIDRMRSSLQLLRAIDTTLETKNIFYLGLSRELTEGKLKNPISVNAKYKLNLE